MLQIASRSCMAVRVDQLGDSAIDGDYAIHSTARWRRRRPFAWGGAFEGRTVLDPQATLTSDLCTRRRVRQAWRARTGGTDRFRPPLGRLAFARVDALEIVQTAAAILGAGGVLIAALSLWNSRNQARTDFEDALAREYREIAGALPPAAFYRDQRAELAPAEKQAMLRYFDLSNEQLRLIAEKRVGKATGRIWRSGIKDLMSFGTFRTAWGELNHDVQGVFFSSLRELVPVGERTLPPLHVPPDPQR